MKFQQLIATIFTILTIPTKCQGLTNNNLLDDRTCETWAAEGKCETEPEVLLEFCIKACDDLEKSKAYYKSIEVDNDDSDEFYALKAKNWTGADVPFYEFDGYVSILHVMEGDCDSIHNINKCVIVCERLTRLVTYP
jgi:hypothetical protein